MASEQLSFFKKHAINPKEAPSLVARALRKILIEKELSLSEKEFVNFLLKETNLAT